MLRSLVVVAIVAGISAVLGSWERAQAEREPMPRWVRTVDGWEPRAVLDPGLPRAVPPALHPALVASFELGASVLVLLAFPHEGPRQTATTPRS